MKIEKITLCNLASFEGEHVIDFGVEPLRSAGLFAITGDTGAGKSTLLDAICLALYNRTPRLDDAEKLERNELDNSERKKQAIQASDPRNMMRRGQKTAYSRVEFTLSDGSRYEAGWLCRVKRTGTYDTVSRSLRQISPRKKDIASGTDKEVQPLIDEIVGLDYMQFSRTVMLAQGSFATFLQAKKRDKSALLEKLTGTEIYGLISMKIYELSGQAEAKAKEIASRIEGILHHRLTPEQLDSIQSDIHQKTTLRDSLQQELEDVKKSLRWLDEYEVAAKDTARLEAENVAARKALSAMRAEQLLLERYDSVQPMQSLFETIQVHQQDIGTLKGQVAVISTALTDGEKQLTEAEQTLATCREQTADANRQLQLRQSDLRQGHALTGEIKAGLLQLSNLKNQLRQEQNSLAGRRQKLAARREELVALQKEIQGLKLHEQALAVHQVMFEKIDLIRDKLNSFRTESEQNGQDHKKLAELQRGQGELQETLIRVERKQQSDSEKLSTLKSELLIHRQNNQGRDGTSLGQEVSEIRNRLLALRHASLLWQRIADSYEDIAERRAKIARDTASMEQTKKDIERARHEAEAQRDAYSHLSEAYMLSNSENIRRLRRSLKEGTSCPVCGATHHPYHTETERELGELMDNLEKDYNEARLELDRKQQALDFLVRKLAEDEGGLRADKQHLQQCEKTLRADEKEWQDFAYLDTSFAECSPAVNRPARQAFMGMLLDNARKAEREKTEELETFNYHQAQINRFTEQVEQLTAQMADDKGNLDKLRTTQKINQAHVETIQQRVARSDRSCEQLYRDLDGMITLSEWFADWKRNPDNFRLRLTNLAQDWLTTRDGLKTSTAREANAEQELRTMEEALAEAARRCQQTQDEHDALLHAVEGKREEIRRLFGALTPEQEEQRLQDYVAKMQQAQQVAQDTYDETNNRLRQLQGQHQSIEASRQDKQRELREQMSRLDILINNYNANNPPLQFSELADLFGGNHAWAEIRARLDALRGDVSLAAHQLEEARNRLVRLQSDGKSLTAEQVAEERRQLQARLSALSAQIEQNAAALLGQQTLLHAHERSTKQAAKQQQVLDDARQDALQWKRLTDLFGSADGKRFRQQAQSYTFRYLVAHANQHLRQLSPRYQLRTPPGTLLLEIIDRDMFDQARYVTSLSGGETFVVSLALALGLASLSTGGISIGSLFIDEGFGNLDQESLDLVMDALSKLENSQGRKVGIISHTAQIRQQISPQIRVRKQPTGARSTISVL
ncbi:MAG: AAA family ATPase [Alloprevotella sp.]|nr:AAA family ATPase [Alloprevotella sp.]